MDVPIKEQEKRHRCAQVDATYAAAGAAPATLRSGAAARENCYTLVQKMIITILAFKCSANAGKYITRAELCEPNNELTTLTRRQWRQY